MPHFTEDSLQRIIINPFYAITVATLLTEEHEPAVGEAEWVRVNATLLEAMGGEQWLRQLRHMGVEGWLRQLLDVLDGDVVTAGEVGFAPPDDPFGYGAPARASRQRREKRKRKKRRRR